MRIHFQRSIEFCVLPRARFYRRPWLIWLRWLGRSAFITSTLSSQQLLRQTGE